MDWSEFESPFMENYLLTPDSPSDPIRHGNGDGLPGLGPRQNSVNSESPIDHYINHVRSRNHFKLST